MNCTVSVCAIMLLFLGVVIIISGIVVLFCKGDRSVRILVFITGICAGSVMIHTGYIFWCG